MPAQATLRMIVFLLALVVIGIIGLSGAVALTAQTAQPAATLTRFAFTSAPSSLPPQLRFTPSQTVTPGHTLTPSPTAFPTRTVSANAGTAVASLTHSATPQYLQCAWARVRQPLPDLTAQAQAVFDENQFETIVNVEAYGENCIDYRGGTPSVAYFAAMSTDFYVQVYTTSLPDTDQLIEHCLKAYELLLPFIADTSLPARPGYLSMTFNTPDYMATVRAMLSDVERALEDGLTGEALLEALGGRLLIPFPQPT
ncbi:MAG: hypothetical protein SF123_10975 [Chloroflexota bacterium]|nr:hypothetical protein [Chloroflexota bacterium]